MKSTAKMKVVNAVATIIAAPKIIKANRAESKANRDVSTLKRARAYDNAPDSANGGDAGRTRLMAQEIKNRK